jgi:lysophospholipase L1-like esterase
MNCCTTFEKKPLELANFVKKLNNKQDVCIGFLGGSITLAEGYRPQFVKWLQSKYPDSTISHINAGIGGTGSVLGVCRIDEDILKHNPDLIFVEFAVNDTENTSRQQCRSAMEGIVRKIRHYNSKTTICFLYTINSKLREAILGNKVYWTIEIMEEIAKHYDIPSINFGPEVVRLEKEEKLVYRVEQDSEEEKRSREEGKLIFSYDYVHPTLNDGHGLYLKVLTDNWKTIAESIHPEQGEAWKNACMVPLDHACLSSEWNKTTATAENLCSPTIQRLGQLWKTKVPGAEISFKFKGTGFGLFGIFGLNSGQFKVFIDGQEYPQTALFDKYGNSYRVHYRMIIDDLDDAMHDVRLILDDEQPDRSILLPERQITDRSKLNGIIAYLGKIMIIGDLV